MSSIASKEVVVMWGWIRIEWWRTRRVWMKIFMVFARELEEHGISMVYFEIWRGFMVLSGMVEGS